MYDWGKKRKMLVFTGVYVCVKAKLTFVSFFSSIFLFCTFPLINLFTRIGVPFYMLAPWSLLMSLDVLVFNAQTISNVKFNHSSSDFQRWRSPVIACVATGKQALLSSLVIFHSCHSPPIIGSRSRQLFTIQTANDQLNVVHRLSWFSAKMSRKLEST